MPTDEQMAKLGEAVKPHGYVLVKLKSECVCERSVGRFQQWPCPVHGLICTPITFARLGTTKPGEET